MANDIEHLFMFLLAVRISFFSKMFIQILCLLFNWVIYLFTLSPKYTLCIRDASSL